jgi:hypothetical protein
MQSSWIVTPLLPKSMQATSSVTRSGLAIDVRCMDRTGAAGTLDVPSIERDRQRLNFDAGCIDREITRSPREIVHFGIDAACIDFEAAASKIDVGPHRSRWPRK